MFGNYVYAQPVPAVSPIQEVFVPSYDFSQDYDYDFDDAYEVPAYSIYGGSGRRGPRRQSRYPRQKYQQPYHVIDFDDTPDYDLNDCVSNVPVTADLGYYYDDEDELALLAEQQRINNLLQQSRAEKAKRAYAAREEVKRIQRQKQIQQQREVQRQRQLQIQQLREAQRQRELQIQQQREAQRQRELQIQQQREAQRQRELQRQNIILQKQKAREAQQQRFCHIGSEGCPVVVVPKCGRGNQARLHRQAKPCNLTAPLSFHSVVSPESESENESDEPVFFKYFAASPENSCIPSATKPTATPQAQVKAPVTQPKVSKPTKVDADTVPVFLRFFPSFEVKPASQKVESAISKNQDAPKGGDQKEKSQREEAATSESETTSDAKAKFATIANCIAELTKRRSEFHLPEHLDFGSKVNTDSVVPKLTFSQINLPFLEYEDFLVSFLSKLDAIDSEGSDEIRKARKAVIKSVQHELDILDKEKESQWSKSRSEENEASRSLQESQSESSEGEVEKSADVSETAKSDGSAHPEVSQPNEVDSTEKPIQSEQSEGSTSTDNSTESNEVSIPTQSEESEVVPVEAEASSPVDDNSSENPLTNESVAEEPVQNVDAAAAASEESAEASAKSPSESISSKKKHGSPKMKSKSKSKKQRKAKFNRADIDDDVEMITSSEDSDWDQI